MRTSFFFLYYVLSLVLYIISIPIILYFSSKSKYKDSLPARFFLQNSKKFKKDGIWFHACSLGEAKALEPLIKNIKNSQVNISVITHTGFSAASSYKDAVVRYLPYELFLPFWQTKQKLLIVLEAELWYMLFVVAKNIGTKTVLLNARISDRSYPKYKKMKWFYKRLFLHVDLIYAQSEIDKERFKALGAKNIKVIGNIKLAQKIKATKTYEKPDGLTIVAGSTHPSEEELILKAFLEFKKTYKGKARLIVVPRHPERFSDVSELMQEISKQESLSFSRFSEDDNLHVDLKLIDSMGELNNIYAISDIAILGGAFAPIGGHNPLEPIAFGCKIISGKKIFNQQELFKYVKNAQLVEESELTIALDKAIEMPKSSIEEKVDLSEINKLIKEYDG